MAQNSHEFSDWYFMCNSVPYGARQTSRSSPIFFRSRPRVSINASISSSIDDFLHQLHCFFFAIPFHPHVITAVPAVAFRCSILLRRGHHDLVELVSDAGKPHDESLVKTT